MGNSEQIYANVHVAIANRNRHSSGPNPHIYEIFVINDTDFPLEELLMSTGGFCTVDNGHEKDANAENGYVVTLKPGYRNFGTVPARSFVLIDYVSEMDLDFTQKWDFRCRFQGQLWTSEITLGRGGVGLLLDLIPICKKMGRLVSRFKQA